MNFQGLAASYSHRGKPPTTIGAEELNFRVRYGNGCDLFAIATRPQVSLDEDNIHYTNSIDIYKYFFYKDKKFLVWTILIRSKPDKTDIVAKLITFNRALFNLSNFDSQSLES